MKKYFLLVSFLFFLSCLTTETNTTEDTTNKIEKTVNYKFWTQDECPALIYNDVWKKLSERSIQILIKKQMDYYKDGRLTEKTEYQLYYDDFINRNCITLEPYQKAIFIEYLTKYLEWEKIAIADKVKLEKDIGDVSYRLSWCRSSGDEWHTTYLGSDTKLLFSFFSQSENRHQLTLNFNKETSSTNRYSTNKPETIYLDKTMVIKLLKLLSDDYIEDQYQVYLKQEKEKAEKFQ